MLHFVHDVLMSPVVCMQYPSDWYGVKHCHERSMMVLKAIAVLLFLLKNNSLS